MKNIIIAVCFTVIAFMFVLMTWERDFLEADIVQLNGQIQADNAKLDNNSILASSWDGVLNACRGDLEGDGYVVSPEPPFGTTFIFPTSTHPFGTGIKVSTDTPPSGSWL